MRFRVLRDAAPLKRAAWLDRVEGGDGFPRPSGRGSIEAVPAPMRSIFSSRFPRPSGRGSIEACIGHHDTPAHHGFPRPSGRGSIEA